MKCLKQLHVEKNIVEGHSLRTVNNIFPQHRTAQRVTARRSVNNAFSLLSSLFSPLLSHTLLSSVSRQKKAKINLIQTGKSLWPFSEIRGCFAGSWLFLTGIGGRSEKTPVGNHFRPMVFASSPELHCQPWGKCDASCVCRFDPQNCSSSSLPLSGKVNVSL